MAGRAQIEAFADGARIDLDMYVVDAGMNWKWEVLGTAGLGPGGGVAESRIDPAPQFTAACRDRHPGVDVRDGVAEHLPWPEGEFGATATSLVLGFMSDPEQGVREMACVTRPGGIVAAYMWDITAAGYDDPPRGLDGVRQVGAGVEGKSMLAGTAVGNSAQRFTEST